MHKNVLITGCSSGIGYELALAFHKRGYRVWASARRHSESMKRLENQGIRCLVLDILIDQQVHQAIDTIINTDQKLDILVNNAGYGCMGPLLDLSQEDMERQFSTHVFAPLKLIKAAVPHMKGQNSGTIVNIGSISGVLATPFSGSYCASKAAQNVLSDVLRMELKPLGIEVVTVQPGAVQTEFANNADKGLSGAWKASSYYDPSRQAFLKERELLKIAPQNPRHSAKPW